MQNTYCKLDCIYRSKGKCSLYKVSDNTLHYINSVQCTTFKDSLNFLDCPNYRKNKVM